MRRKFISLLGIPLKGATPARGIIEMVNDRAPIRSIELPKDFEARSGPVPFVFGHGMTLLPIEGRLFYKKKIENPDAALSVHYNQLYQSFKGAAPSSGLSFYETKPFPSIDGSPMDIAAEAIDASLWIALAARSAEEIEETRNAIGGKGLFFGLVPAVDASGRELLPAGAANTEASITLHYDIPVVSPLPADDASKRTPAYRMLETRATVSTEGLTTPGIEELLLPSAPELTLWKDLDPLEAGAGDFPPSLEDTKLEARVITWVRVRFQGGIHARLLWAGVNAAAIEQRVRVRSETFKDMSGSPDQIITLGHRSIIASSVELFVTPPGGAEEQWEGIDDLSAAGPEIPLEDMTKSPGVIAPNISPKVKVFAVDEEAGVIRFGNGFQGARPPRGSQARVAYDYSLGAAGNVGKATITVSPMLPTGIRIDNPVRTWGGASSQNAVDGEQRIAGYIQRQNRMVTAEDFKTIVKQTPGIDVGRVDVLPAYNPAFSPNEPGDAPGTVTLMVLPAFDKSRPEWPAPDTFFCKAICDFVSSRRLITTELYIRGPVYKPVWISIGLDITAGIPLSSGEICEQVKKDVKRFLSSLPDSGGSCAPWIYPERVDGWPLRKAVTALQLTTVIARVNGVSTVNSVLLADEETPGDAAGGVAQSPMTGLQLPFIAGISVSAGEPVPLINLQGKTGNGADNAAAGNYVPVPLVQESCKPWM
jgi:hypothetical protein